MPLAAPEPSRQGVPAWEDDDLQLALWCCYELHYRGFEDVDDDWQWHPAVTGFRGTLERPWLASLRALAGWPDPVPAGGLPGALRELTGRGGGPDLAGYLAREADREQFTEFAVHRSVYQLKEAAHGRPLPSGATRTPPRLPVGPNTLVTSGKPDDLPAFCATFTRVFSRQSQHA